MFIIVVQFSSLSIELLGLKWRKCAVAAVNWSSTRGQTQCGRGTHGTKVVSLNKDDYNISNLDFVTMTSGDSDEELK